MSENIRELETIGELESLDVLEDVEADDGTPEELSSSLNPYRTSMFPILVLNKRMKILYANPACEHLFTGFFSLSGNYFIDIFGKAFGLEGIKSIRETIVTGEHGFSWKGTAQIKSRSTVSVQTRVYIFPAEMDIKAPAAFVVLFDDVTEENRHLLRSVFLSLLEASKLKDNDTGKHISRVNFYSKRFAEELFRSGVPACKNIDADFIDNIGFLASMHDVGKIGTPDDILNKEGPLSDWEWTIMREHTKNGAFILSTYPNPMAKEIALAHHEKWNGAGYPFQLEGEMIPLSARIVAIADVYDALRMERSYKPALSHKITLEKIYAEKGTHFDPSLIEVFKCIADDFRDIFESNRD
ncbi:MAG: HD domain-containing protein [Treponema sp.]|jgi:putative two-component system response regulator|nr:HD domain-containing protein [Treponema sp.]